ncbi:biopolymer transporter Tol [Solidesulfovibrio magneticus]|nr:biopolymer transporter Tol [Solidesulfovibrio magneticus]
MLHEKSRAQGPSGRLLRFRGQITASSEQPMARRCLLTSLLLVFVTTAPLRAEVAIPPLVYTLGDAVMFKTGGQSIMLGHGSQPTLSPEARQAAWVEHGDDPAQARLMLCDIASGNASILAKPGGNLHSPSFSPDGGNVIFVRRTETGQSELWSVRPGEKPRKLAQAGGLAGDDFFEPVFSLADGRILYHDLESLYSMSLTGQKNNQTPLKNFNQGHTGAFTSTARFIPRPNSTTLAFSMSVEGSPLFRKKVPDLSSALFLYDPQSRSASRLTPHNITAFAPAWTTDGQALVFTGYSDKHAGTARPFRIWMIRPGQPPVDMGPGEDPRPASGP